MNGSRNPPETPPGPPLPLSWGPITLPSNPFFFLHFRESPYTITPANLDGFEILASRDAQLKETAPYIQRAREHLQSPFPEDGQSAMGALHAHYNRRYRTNPQRANDWQLVTILSMLLTHREGVFPDGGEEMRFLADQALVWSLRVMERRGLVDGGAVERLSWTPMVEVFEMARGILERDGWVGDRRGEVARFEERRNRGGGGGDDGGDGGGNSSDSGGGVDGDGNGSRGGRGGSPGDGQGGDGEMIEGSRWIVIGLVAVRGFVQHDC